MKLIPVESVPERRGKHRLQDLIQEFVDSSADVVKVDFSERDYKSASVCRSCLANAIIRSRCSVKVWRRGDEVFLSRG